MEMHLLSCACCLFDYRLISCVRCRLAAPPLSRLPFKSHTLAYGRVRGLLCGHSGSGKRAGDARSHWWLQTSCQVEWSSCRAGRFGFAIYQQLAHDLGSRVANIKCHPPIPFRQTFPWPRTGMIRKRLDEQKGSTDGRVRVFKAFDVGV